MRWRRAFALWVSAGVSAVGLAQRPYPVRPPQPPVPAQPPATWRKLFNFDNGEQLKYALVTHVRGERVEGLATLDFTEKGKERLEIRVEGSMGGNASSTLETSFGPEDGEMFVSGNWATTEPARVLVATVLSPHWPFLFKDKDLKAGNRWSAHDGEVEANVEVFGGCAAAGLKGIQGRWVVRRGRKIEVEADWCISPDIPLALKADIVLPKDRVSTEATLTTYRREAPSAPREEVAGATPAAPPQPTSPSQPSTPASLQGFYAGTTPGGLFAVYYLFTRSGRVATDFKQVVDPEAAAGWQTKFVPIGEEIPDSDLAASAVLGTYELLADKVRLRTREVDADPERQTLWLRELWKENWEKDKVQEKSFRAATGYGRIEIDGTPLLRQKDQTGRKLNGEFAHESFFPARNSVRASFTAAGEFSLEELSLGRVGTGMENKGSGRYEVHEHEVVLRYSDGRVERRVFADLGRDEHGRELIALGSFVLTRGLFAGK